MPLTKLTCGVNYTTNSIKDNINELIDKQNAQVINGDTRKATEAVKALTLDGQVLMTRTETNGDETRRPVWFDLNYYINPNTSPAAVTDYHGFDLFGDVSSDSYNQPLANAQLYLFESKSFYSGTSFLGSSYAGFFESSNRSTGTIGNNIALRLWARNEGTGGINNNYAIRITATSNSGTITNNYGIDVGDITGATNPENNYAIRTGLGKVSFGDRVELADILKLGQYSTATLPSASDSSGCVVSISDSAGKPSPIVYSNGANWLYMDNTTV